MTMEFLMLSGNPKADGLCAGMEEAVRRGAEAGGARVARVTTEGMLRCQVCGTGWGTCREEHVCVLAEQDAFAQAQAAVRGADAYCLITPVYWGEMAEGLKSFLDRLRRCEFMRGGMAGKPVLLVATPGGSGNGLMSCLEQMDRFVRHMGALPFDYIGANRWNHDYKRETAFQAAQALASGRKPGESL
jgi:multimeric flavodoxin WrbA